ncbi:MAG: hypothetical protein HWN67_03915 [Candidatus Helarchaeota archaeon]|nr:hypothetical protein [Candidatus Helarchaeota archaeon]
MAGPLKKGKLPADVLKMEETAKASQYLRAAVKALRDFMPLEQKTNIWGTLEKIFTIEPTETFDYSMYFRDGYKQSQQKAKFQEAGKSIALERGLPSYNRAVGAPIGQDKLKTYVISSTDVEVEVDQLNCINNPAMRNLLNDVKRTIIFNLDIPHGVVQIRAGREVTPQTVNQLLETMEHNISGGNVLLDQLSEIYPGLTKDAYCKVITGNDEVQEVIDSRFVIDINKQFHSSRAKKLKAALGDTLYLVARAPSILVNNIDSSIALKWVLMQGILSFFSTYRLTRTSTISDLAYATKKANCILMGERTWPSRGHSLNSPGGIPFGFLADICQQDSQLPARPFLEVAKDENKELARKYIENSIGCLATIIPIITEQFWHDLYLLGGRGYSTALLTSAICGDVYGEFLDMMIEIIQKYFVKLVGAGKKTYPVKWDSIKWVIETMISNAMEKLEKLNTSLEFLASGDEKTYIIGSIGGNIAALLTGSPTAGAWGLNYSRSLLIKEGWLRTGEAGNDMPDYLGLPYSCSLKLEEGGLLELRGMNTPYLASTIGNAFGLVGATYCAALGRGDPWVCSPLIKVAFADPHLKFDFSSPKEEIIKGALNFLENL